MDEPMELPLHPRRRDRALADDLLVSWIELFLETHRYAPSLREIAAGCGWSSVSTAAGRLQRLRALGLVDWNDNEQRTIRSLRR